ncbi:conserved exported hypothetical protein [Tenacibaculum sp. 190524A02b]|uniref:Uncharacterized protein n=1 Tax=Tenacibaculum vairaonense TaxID=3137860 RepID=A0ABM9PNW1_9FLAO
MKKTLFILLFALINYTTITAQEFSVVKSDIFKDKKKHSYLSFAIDDQNEGLITIRGYKAGFPLKTTKGYYIQHFDKDLKLIKEYVYEVKKNRLESAFVKDGKLHLIEFEHLIKEKTINYNVVSTNLDKFNFTSKQLLSLSKENIKKYLPAGPILSLFLSSSNAQVDSDYMGEVTMSKSNNFFSIIFDFKNKEKETHKIFSFNNDFELLYEKLITKDIKDKLFKYNNVEVDDNDGSVYFLGKAFENNSTKRKRKGKANYHFELIKVDAQGEKSISFKKPEKFIGTLSLVKNNDKLSCIGFFGNKKEEKYNGVCVFNLDSNTLSIKNEKFNLFTETFLTDKYGSNERRKSRKKKKGIADIEFRSVQAMDNGDLVINAEEDYLTTHTYSGANGSFRTRTIRHFDDIISLRVDIDGNLKWARNINKAQTGYQNSSFTPISIGETTYLFINCSDKFKKLKGDRISFKQTSAKKSNLYMISISGNGKFDYKKVIDRKDSEVFYKVNGGIAPDSKNEVILLGKKKKKSQIVKIKIQS